MGGEEQQRHGGQLLHHGSSDDRCVGCAHTHLGDALVALVDNQRNRCIWPEGKLRSAQLSRDLRVLLYISGRVSAEGGLGGFEWKRLPAGAVALVCFR
jgi:hypothetical protein